MRSCEASVWKSLWFPLLVLIHAFLISFSYNFFLLSLNFVGVGSLPPRLTELVPTLAVVAGTSVTVWRDSICSSITSIVSSLRAASWAAI